MKWKMIGCGILAIACGALTSSYVSSWLVSALINLDWRSHIQAWMTAHGMGGSFVGHFGIFYIKIPDYTLAILGGIIIGLIAWRRWWQLSLLYSGTMVVFPYILSIMSGIPLIIYSVWIFVKVAMFDILIIPLALGGAWVVSRRPRRRAHREVRMASGLCLKCGYNLTGNVSGVCPECGEQIDGRMLPSPLRG